MSTLQQVINSIHSLEPAEVAILRSYLDQELTKSPTRAAESEPSSLIGILADAPELADFVRDSAMKERESRPWRVADE